jgi:hypothetical protein
MIKLPVKLNKEINEYIRTFTKDTLYDIIHSTENNWTLKHHSGIGLFVRNQWRLWKKQGMIYKFFINHGITQPDDMSDIILHIMYRRVNELPDNIETLLNKQESLDIFK